MHGGVGAGEGGAQGVLPLLPLRADQVHLVDELVVGQGHSDKEIANQEEGPESDSLLRQLV